MECSDRKKGRVITLRQYRNYARGPIPDEWMRKAGRLSSNAIAIGFVLWKLSYQKKLWGESGLRNRSFPVRLTNKMVEDWGISRFIKNKTLKEMEEEGLLLIRQKKGSSPDIIIVDDFLQNEITT